METQENTIPTLYVIEIFYALMSKELHTPILVNEIQDICTDKDLAVRLAKGYTEHLHTPAFVKDAVNDIVVREARFKGSRMEMSCDTDVWSAAAERLLAWQDPQYI